MNAESQPGGETVPIHEDVDVAVVRGAVRRFGTLAGLSRAATEALATASSELARNILVHARWGDVSVQTLHSGGRHGVVVVARDEGPGITDIERAMEDGYSTAGSLGLGLPAARRLVHEFELTSDAKRGTVVVLKEWRL